MRNPDAKNPSQQSVYVDSATWAAVREMSSRLKQTMSAFIVSLIERERDKVLGKDWSPTGRREAGKPEGRKK